jgi:hypothetical protein
MASRRENPIARWKLDLDLPLNRPDDLLGPVRVAFLEARAEKVAIRRFLNEFCLCEPTATEQPRPRRTNVAQATRLPMP